MIKGLINKNKFINKYFYKFYYFIKKSALRFKINNDIIGENNLIFYSPNCVFSNITFDIKGNNNKVVINGNCKLNNVTFYIRGNNCIIELDEHIYFNEKGTLWIEDDHGKIIIGSHSTFEDILIASTEPNSEIIIGKDCMFSHGIEIRTGDSHSIYDINTNKRINYAKNISIGDHVWAGANSTFLKGSKVSSNSIVGIKSLVTQQFVENNVIIGGIPGKIIKRNITWGRKRTYDN
ncbi:acyltransferase [Apibacter sp. HY039]|uniref:acyltransferase n=1 Tax=Apibacter sp. HY039 TaxID=2501476 RepID=UPI000FEBF8F4|nr:acyltransferase [Apibacter sp. HY039]